LTFRELGSGEDGGEGGEGMTDVMLDEAERVLIASVMARPVSSVTHL
jgi:hypothetical protein